MTDSSDAVEGAWLYRGSVSHGFYAFTSAPPKPEPDAMRKPTEAMLNAARDWSIAKYGRGIGNDAATGCWQAMLDAVSPAIGVTQEAIAQKLDEVAEIKSGVYLSSACRSAMAEAILAMFTPVPDATVSAEPLQSRVLPWLLECFGPVIPFDKTERNHRFLEEALELVQACGCTQDEAHQLVNYVYGRNQGDINQEVGGVMITLAALCLANGFDMHAAGDIELARIWTKVEQIRAKQAAKPKHSPLPVVSSPRNEGRETTSSKC